MDLRQKGQAVSYSFSTVLHCQQDVSLPLNVVSQVLVDAPSPNDTRTFELKMYPTTHQVQTAYQTAYNVLNPPPGSQRDRRAVERLPFRFVQRIAAYDGQRCFEQLRFFPVQCHDISRRGMAFVLPGQLDFSRLVVELGSDDERMYFEAEIVNYRQLSNTPNNNVNSFLASMGGVRSAPKSVLIGCRFESKLDFPPA